MGNRCKNKRWRWFPWVLRGAFVSFTTVALLDLLFHTDQMNTAICNMSMGISDLIHENFKLRQEIFQLRQK